MKPSAKGLAPEQLRYALWIEWLARLGMASSVLLFCVYAWELMPSGVPPQRLAQWWGLPLQDFLRQAGGTTALPLSAAALKADSAALLGIAILASACLPALLAVVFGAWRRGDRSLAALCLLQSLVLALAASGLVNLGH